MSDKKLTDKELETEALLGSLAPRSVELNREEIIYESGFAAAKKQSQNQVRIWMSLAACFAMFSLFSFTWNGSTENQLEPNLVQTPIPETNKLPAPEIKKVNDNPNTNFSLRQLAISQGIENLPELSNSFSIASGPHESISNRKMLISMLNPKEQ